MSNLLFCFYLYKAQQKRLCNKDFPLKLDFAILSHAIEELVTGARRRGGRREEERVCGEVYTRVADEKRRAYRE
ncbi:hypothetical protein L6452_36442 [Arctium lappa]|uniref:Uncharacterized protein n=1 Tax=Arctium lappa TaxID=4217 RepID=A0ACB8Y9W1_ARCLA|nr:hypothetical protein L6452_36442 [Arctium lappa]